MRTIPIVAASLLVVTALACSGDYERVSLLACPGEPEITPEQLRAVSAVVEKRCGTIDCHGSLARPMRIYGINGLRYFDVVEEGIPLPEDLQEEGRVPGGELATTEDELEQNRRSMCGLEPEQMGRVLNGEIPPEDLMLLRKPLEVERHKGGQLFIAKSDPGAVCLVSWLNRQVDLTACNEAVQQP